MEIIKERERFDEFKKFGLKKFNNGKYWIEQSSTDPNNFIYSTSEGGPFKLVRYNSEKDQYECFEIPDGINE